MKKKKSSHAKKAGKHQKSRDGLSPHVLISGYYGFDNLGDELILKVLTDELKAKGVKITVLSNNPRKTATQYDVQSIHRMNFIDIIDALSRANAFISGGGGLFQDATGPASPLYYGGLIHLAHFFEVPVCFWAQGVGPLNHSLSRKVTASALHKCESIVVRDEQSARLIEEISGLEVEATADPVWLLKLPKKPPALKASGKDKRGKKSGKQATPWRLGVSLRPWGALSEQHLTHLRNLFQQIAEQSNKPVELLLLPFQKQEDTHLLQTFTRNIQSSTLSVRMIPPEEVLVQFQTCDAILGMRFHSLILGLLAKLPVYGLIYDPKVDNLLRMFNLPGCRIEEIENLTADVLQTAFSQAQNVDLSPLKKESRRNFKILNQLLNIPEAELVR
ncbi:MAG TPA: polysaccharide pyruvyl transferase CsaB [Oculatellaceae cyanobacterium]|jgi:polysaccharide pyruvyl transferase CsaB